MMRTYGDKQRDSFERRLRRAEGARDTDTAHQWHH